MVWAEGLGVAELALQALTSGVIPIEYASRFEFRIQYLGEAFSLMEIDWTYLRSGPGLTSCRPTKQECPRGRGHGTHADSHFTKLSNNLQ
jgi:hypothetical protein